MTATAARTKPPAAGSTAGAMTVFTRFTLLLLSAAAWGAAALYFHSRHGHFDFGRHAVGRDFVIIWTASHMVAEGHALDVFQPERFLAAAHRLFDPALPYHFWSYPPTALLNILPLGRLDYFPAYVLWNVVGLALLALAARAFFGRSQASWLLMLSPAVATNLVMGQNGFLTAALLFAGLAVLDRRPLRAGVFFGLLGFKPQMGFLLPVGLIAAGRWRTILAAAVVGVSVAALSVAVFGLDAWRAFLEFTAPAQSHMMVGYGPFRWMTPSPFMSGLILTDSPAVALLTQLPFTALGLWLAWRAFRRDGDPQLSAAALFVATFLASPQSFNYDMIPIAAAALVLAGRNIWRGDLVLAQILWIAPLLVIPLNAAGEPVYPVVLAAAGIRLDTIARTQHPATSGWTPSERRGGLRKAA